MLAAFYFKKEKRRFVFLFQDAKILSIELYTTYAYFKKTLPFKRKKRRFRIAWKIFLQFLLFQFL